MRIDYNILWFENDEGWLKPSIKAVGNLLEAYGFRLKPELHSTGSKIQEIITAIHAKTLDVDMIFMDYMLTGDTNGEKLIKVIRDKNLFTEILFYSMNENVKQIIEKEFGSIEGIYYAGRDTFRDKAKEIIWHTIKKVEDVESMRGLIMGATSEIESMMKEITLEFIETCGDDIKNSIAKPIFDEVGKSVKEKYAKHEEYNPSLNLKKLASDNAMFDANKKAHALQSIINVVNHPELSHLSGNAFYESMSSVISTRNKFGHAKVELNERGIRVLKSAPPIEEFTDARCIEIRKELIKQLDIIKGIKGHLIKPK